MKTFYHADMDGHCAAAIVYKFYDGDGGHKNAAGFQIAVLPFNK
jgi:nanoRNase/pAp phosphatase (c-di-AMP/oligoRNAs hydrolase)